MSQQPPLAYDALQGRTPGWKACDLCETAWRGLVEAKIAAERRFELAEENHTSTLRLYARERSRADRAEARLAALEGNAP